MSYQNALACAGCIWIVTVIVLAAVVYRVKIFPFKK